MLVFSNMPPYMSVTFSPSAIQANQYEQGSNASLEFPQSEDLVNFTQQGEQEMSPARIEIPREVVEERLGEGTVTLEVIKMCVLVLITRCACLCLFLLLNETFTDHSKQLKEAETSVQSINA